MPGAAPENLLEMLVDNISDGIMVDDTEGRVVFANTAFVALFGLEGVDLGELVLDDYVAHEYREVLRDRHDRRIRGEDVPTTFQYAGLHRSGGRLWLEVSVVPVIEDGEKVGTLSCIRDLTMRKRAEEDYRRLFEGSQDPILLLDGRTLEVLEANPSAHRLYGATPGALVGRSIAELSLAHLPAALGQEDDAWAKVELRHTRGEHTSDLIVTASRIRHRDAPAIVCHCHDITLRRQLEQRTLQMQKMEATGRLAGGIAHDFNNIVTAVLGYAELLSARLVADAEAQRDLLEIIRAGERSEELTAQLLAIARKQVVRPEIVAVAGALRNTRSSVATRLESVSLEVDVDPGVGGIRVDRGQFQQMLTSLLDNARDALGEGGRIRVRADVIDGASPDLPDLEPMPYVRVSVSDDGEGMDEETLSRIFDPFFTTRTSAMGLGLATTRALAEENGGHVRVESEPGLGSVFDLWFPRVEIEEADRASTPPPVVSGGSERILLVEDEEAVRNVMQRALEQAGYEILPAESAADALGIAQSREFDMIVSDVVMPGMSGPELVDKLCADRPRLPVLLVSGHVEDRRGGRHDPGERPFLQKPFRLHELTSRVGVLLAGTGSPSQPTSDPCDLDIDFVRSHFPALTDDVALMDNAGGTVPALQVIRRVTDYLSRFAVQLGASYPQSVGAEQAVRDGEAAMAELVGAENGEIVVGPSTTLNAMLLAQAVAAGWSEGDQIVVSELDHEANVHPWRDLEARGLVVREWPINPDTLRLELDDLEPLLTERTRIVAFTHCSNIVGSIHDAAAITRRAHEAGALVCVDGVALAPHRRIDVKALDVDFYLLSAYKVFGPHLGIMYGKRERLLGAKGQHHFFVDEDQVPYKFQPGNPNHELTASLTGLLDYLRVIDRHHGADPDDGGAIDRCFGRFARHEAALSERLLAYLRSRDDVKIIGDSQSDAARRVSTISFRIEGIPSSRVPEQLEPHGVALRFGHFYAYRAADALGLLEHDGVVRASLVHYNTVEEVDRLVAGLGGIRSGS